MTPEMAHTLSLVFFYSFAVVLLVASFMLSDDLPLRKIVMLFLLGEAALGVVVQLGWGSLVAVLLFMKQFIAYVKLLDQKIVHTKSVMYHDLPSWMQNSPDPQVVMDRLDVAARHVGGAGLGTRPFQADERPRQSGRHRLLTIG
jgi:hypothetical protein